MPYMTPGFPHLPCPCTIFSIILLSTMDSHLNATGLGASHRVIRDDNRVGPWVDVDSLQADWASRVEWPPNGQDEKEIRGDSPSSDGQGNGDSGSLLYESLYEFAPKIRQNGRSANSSSDVDGPAFMRLVLDWRPILLALSVLERRQTLHLYLPEYKPV